MCWNIKILTIVCGDQQAEKIFSDSDDGGGIIISDDKQPQLEKQNNESDNKKINWKDVLKCMLTIYIIVITLNNIFLAYIKEDYQNISVKPFLNYVFYFCIIAICVSFVFLLKNNHFTSTNFRCICRNVVCKKYKYQYFKIHFILFIASSIIMFFAKNYFFLSSFLLYLPTSGIKKNIIKQIIIISYIYINFYFNLYNNFIEIVSKLIILFVSNVISSKVNKKITLDKIIVLNTLLAILFLNRYYDLDIQKMSIQDNLLPNIEEIPPTKEETQIPSQEL